jgi:hypothetical protein
MHAQNSPQHLGVHRLFASRRSRLATTISQAQGRDVKEDGAEDVGDEKANGQFEHLLLQR